jgi:hypothetical protein
MIHRAGDDSPLLTEFLEVARVMRVPLPDADEDVDDVARTKSGGARRRKTKK